jgi:hypothetical protein
VDGRSRCLDFGSHDRLDYAALIYFANGAMRAIGVKDGRAILAKVTGDMEMLRKLG